MRNNPNQVLEENHKGLNLLFILIILILFILFIVLPISLIRRFNLIFHPEQIIKVKKRTKFFFGIITIEGSWYKRQLMYDIWIKHIIKQGHDYVYCTRSRIEPKYQWTPLKNWTNSTRYDGNIDREQKRVTMAEYFLKNTDADFYINPTDDVFVDSSRINQLANILGHKYNTNDDLVLLGSCHFHCVKKTAFLQGGSGYIMTRKMAAKFVEYAEKWITESNSYDDYEINRFLSYVNQTPKDAASPYVSGFGFPALNSNNFNFESVKKCPNYFEPLCGTGINRAEDVYILHPNFKLIKPGLKTWYNFQIMINYKNHSYGYYSTHRCRSLTLCKIK